MCDIKNRPIIYIILRVHKKRKCKEITFEYIIREFSVGDLRIDSETYFQRNRLQKNLHYYIYLPDIIKYIIMNKSLPNETISKLHTIPTLAEQI